MWIIMACGTSEQEDEAEWDIQRYRLRSETLIGGLIFSMTHAKAIPEREHPPHIKNGSVEEGDDHLSQIQLLI